MRIGRRLETGRRSESCIYKLMFYLFVHTFMDILKEFQCD
jgi:hypothetical protein